MPEPDRLRDFIEDFLIPVVADGRIEQPEETPLIVAFRVYGIERLLLSSPLDTEAQLIKAVETAVRAGRPVRTAADLEQVWRRVTTVSRNMNWNELTAVREWLMREAWINGVDFVPDVVGCSVSLSAGNDSQHAETVLLFHKWSCDAALAAAKAVPPPAEAAQPIAAPSYPDPVVVVKDVTLDEREWNAVLRAVKKRARLQRAGQILAGIEKEAPKMLFDGFRDADSDRFVVVSGPDDLDPLWFIGDLHGDLLAFEAAMKHIGGASDGRQPRIVFIGDLIDDLEYSLDVALGVWELALEQPGSVCVIAGNHDEGLKYADGKFASSVQPSEFADSLNAVEESDSIERRAGRLFAGFIERMPRAIVLPDGLYAAHGGFPLSDLWAGIHSRRDLNESRCLQDCVWTRASESARTKIPNRNSKGCQFGWQDFEGFCELATRVLGREVSRMVRGHDHFEPRFLLYTRYRKNNMLAINTMCRKLNREIFGDFVRTPCVARWRRGSLPEVHRLAIPEKVVRAVYKESAEATT